MTRKPIAWQGIGKTHGYPFGTADGQSVRHLHDRHGSHRATSGHRISARRIPLSLTFHQDSNTRRMASLRASREYPWAHSAPRWAISFARSGSDAICVKTWARASRSRGSPQRPAMGHLLRPFGLGCDLRQDMGQGFRITGLDDDSTAFTEDPRHRAAVRTHAHEAESHPFESCLAPTLRFGHQHQYIGSRILGHHLLVRQSAGEGDAGRKVEAGDLFREAGSHFTVTHDPAGKIHPTPTANINCLHQDIHVSLRSEEHT